MKKLLFTLSLLAGLQFGFSQETYTVNNETLVLKSEIDGTLELLWTSGTNGVYRYFIKKEDNSIVELKNTKTEKEYNKEYITSLYELTQTDANDVPYTLYGIKYFISDYNSAKDNTYVGVERGKLESRFALFGGITNQPFVSNPENASVPLISAELEVFDAKNESRHVGFVNLRHTFSNSDIEYTATQLALGYRFRFVKSEKINVFAQTKFATITYAKSEELVTDPNDVTNLIEESVSNTTFDAPLIFGFGADFKIGNNSYITVVYDSFFSVVFDNYNFPVDFAVGYKFNL
ncbi:hypothetical protein [Aurantibacter sp.]|uniref:hypothetical protein n=1 Tax=Aurantibacter sp. TaxID=2807103 RepID=UPI0035C81B64